jgi:hypothetical protein
MKKTGIIFILFVQCLFAQTAEKKIWNLLLVNKRAEAQKEYEKEFVKKPASTIEQFLLGEFIKLESGEINFGEQFVSNFSSFPESKFYITPLLKQKFLIDDIHELGFNDLTYQKIDKLASLPIYQLPIIQYYKAISDRNRRDLAGYKKGIASLNALMDWQFCGVFENLNDSGIDIEYEPEIYPKNDKLFDGNSNGQLGWYYPKIMQYEGYHSFSNENEYGTGIIYSQLFVENPEEKEVYFNFGMSHAFKIFVNDVEVYLNTQNSMSDLNAFKLKLTLPKGMNRILLKSSISSGNSYFFFSIKDKNDQQITTFQYHTTYQPYVKSTYESLAVEEVIPDYEQYFLDKIQANPNAVLYQLMLFDAYFHNKKMELAEPIILKLDEQYPNSSIIKTRLANYYSEKGDNAKVNEIIKNIEQIDSDYYYSIASKAVDQNWIRTATVMELEKYREKSKKLQSTLFYELFDFIINARNSDIEAMLNNIDRLLKTSNNSEFYIVNFAPLYDSLEKDKQKTIQMLEDLVARRENFAALSKLVSYYNDANRKEDVKKIFTERINNYPYFIGVASDYITMLIDEKKYAEALDKVDQALMLYPYSFVLLEKKGMIHHYLKQEKEAEIYLRKSLEHNPENNALRKQIYDIKKIPDEIEVVDIKDKYKLIKERRNSKMKSDYGVVTLFDEYIVNILPEGGQKSKVVLIYEITGDSGIDEMKEYNLNTYGINLVKSEVIKKDGAIVPAEVGDDVLVFANLLVGDVVYVEYDFFSQSSGRFYKDFNLDCYFNSTYPSHESVFILLHPEEVTYQFQLFNGDIKPLKSKVNAKTCTTWRRLDVPAIPLLESYSKDYKDLTNTIKVSSIPSWKVIANWYADLVKKSIASDNATKKAFEQLFPKGTNGMSQEQIAKTIYTFISDNINYSSQDFRQSGYVPQKPSKTLSTRLGDCKDVSTLFVAFSELAGIQSNLVLVSTNDNSYNNLVLPSREFNHCIVRTQLDGRIYYLELTDKYLPFKALPVNLYKANALVISFDKVVNEKATIIPISFENALPNNIQSHSEVEVTDTEMIFTTKNIYSGSLKSYYNQLFSSATTEDVRKKELENNYQSLLNKTIVFNGAKVIQNEPQDSSIEFETTFKVADRLKNVGSLKILDIPFTEKVYTRNIINSEVRNYDIHYVYYENNWQYQSEILIKIGNGKKFTEIPEPKTFSFKNHRYSISFTLVDNQTLNIKREVMTTWDDISKEDYPSFKNYVNEILLTEEQIIGFK